MRRLVLFLPLLLLLAAACTAPPADPFHLPLGGSDHTVRVGGLDRTYRAYRPTAAKGRVQLVVVLHGAAGSGRQAEQSYGWDGLADRAGFVVAYPDGIGRTWNAAPECCGEAARDRVDDVGFLAGLVTAVRAEAPIDRVFVAGISHGALLAYRLACETTLFTAVAAVAGTMISPCPHPSPISVIHIHGLEDQTIPYGGGPGSLPARIDGPPVADLIATWRAVDSCPAPQVTVNGLVTYTVARCPGGRAVSLITVGKAGHGWPGQPGPGPGASRPPRPDPASRVLDATGTIWRFFCGV